MSFLNPTRKLHTIAQLEENIEIQSRNLAITQFCNLFLQMGHSWPLFLYFRLFNFNVQLVDNIFANVGIQTAGLWCQKQSLYQLSHHPYPNNFAIIHRIQMAQMFTISVTEWGIWQFDDCRAREFFLSTVYFFSHQSYFGMSMPIQFNWIIFQLVKLKGNKSPMRVDFSQICDAL